MQVDSFVTALCHDYYRVHNTWLPLLTLDKERSGMFAKIEQLISFADCLLARN